MIDDGLVKLALGQGGGATARFLRDEILARFRGDALASLEDGAYINSHDCRFVVTTDSYVVDPPLFPGGDIGVLAVSGTVNDLVSCGAQPRWLTLGLVISEGLPQKVLRQALDSVRDTANATSVEVVAGDTKVVPQAGKLGLCINTTGIGLTVHRRSFSLDQAQDGDAIVVTGTLGDHEIAVLSAREGLGFDQRIRSDVMPLAGLVLPLLTKHKGVRSLRDPTRGGLGGVLLDLADASGFDVLLNTEVLPLRREVAAACEMLGLEPLNLVNEGKMMMVVSACEADAVLADLKAHEAGQQAAIVGHLQRKSTTKPRVVLLRQGSERILIRQEGSPLPRLC